MALNKNHEFEELDGVKCGIVEKNVKPERVAFLKNLLEYNGYTVVAVPSPAPKAMPAPKPADGKLQLRLLPRHQPLKLLRLALLIILLIPPTLFMDEC